MLTAQHDAARAPESAPHLPSAAEANAAVRAFAAGRVSWTPETLAELDQLRRAWADAVRREMVAAA